VLGRDPVTRPASPADALPQPTGLISRSRAARLGCNDRCGQPGSPFPHTSREYEMAALLGQLRRFPGVIRALRMG
jgi:hypothetical protein